LREYNNKNVSEPFKTLVSEPPCGLIRLYAVGVD